MDPLDVPLSVKGDLLVGVTGQAHREGAGLAEASYKIWDTRKWFTSSEGHRIDQHIRECGGGMSATVIGEGETQCRSYPPSRGQYGIGGWELVDQMDLPAHATRIAEEAQALLCAPQCPADRTGAEIGAPSTGHAVLNVDGRSGPEPTGLRICAADQEGELATTDGGPAGFETDGPASDSEVARLVAGVDRGVLVTDRCYTRVLDPRTLVMTGLTRNGVWLIESGQIVAPVRNLRFTQSYPEALGPGAVLGIGRQGVRLASRYGDSSTVVPALRLASWNFTGGTSG